MLRLSVNWMVICVTPSALVDVIESMPAMVVNCRSSGVATADAIVSGLAPGQRGRHLDGREVDVRQVVHGQEAVRHHAEDDDGRHQQRGQDRPADEEIGVHDGLGGLISTRAPGHEPELAVGDDSLARPKPLVDDHVAGAAAGRPSPGATRR